MNGDTQVWWTILQNVILGPVLIGLAIAYVRLQRQLHGVQEARVADAQKVTTTLLDISKRQNEVTTELTRVLDHNTKAIEELRMTIREDRRHGGQSGT